MAVHCQWQKNIHVDVVKPQKIIIKNKGEYKPEIYDTLNGQITDIDFVVDGGNTIIRTDIYCHDSILLRLGEKVEKCGMKKSCSKVVTSRIDFKDKVYFTRQEPNVLLLDQAEYAFDGGSFKKTEDILKADNLYREKLGYPPRQNAIAQPWTMEEKKPEHYIALRFRINCEIEIENADRNSSDKMRISCYSFQEALILTYQVFHGVSD